jgi:hypothetical protein
MVDIVQQDLLVEHVDLMENWHDQKRSGNGIF